ncbi:MAG: carboxypeptidase regulatory-like domain-containing protein [Euryarchaeota archaeon]|nr:carboxypeptidase regulatory-like domain-containing protein [Euryarchaeota archaeon]
MKGAAAAWVTTLALLVSGCADMGEGATTSAPLEAPPAEVDSETGGIEGTVTDDAVNPLADAQVGLIGTPFLTASDASGRFSLSKVPPGAYKFAANRLGYGDFAKSIEVRAGEVTTVNAQLVERAVEETYHVTLRGDGRMGCAFAVKPGTALAACAAGYGTPLDTLDKFKVDFQLTAMNTSKIQELVFETEWSSNQVLSSGFDVYWENYQDWGTGTTYTEGAPRLFARAYGKSPLNTTAVAKKTPTLKYCTWTGTCKIYARVFPYASTTGQSVDASVYFDQRFTHWVTEFYGEPSTPGFTALADK